MKTVVEPVAEALGNTPAISRKSYVHPRCSKRSRKSRAIRSTEWTAQTAKAPVERRSRASRISRTRQPSAAASAKQPTWQVKTPQRDQPPLDRPPRDGQDGGHGGGRASPAGSRPIATELLIGLVTAAVLVAVMLVLRTWASGLAPATRAALGGEGGRPSPREDQPLVHDPCGRARRGRHLRGAARRGSRG